MLKAFLALRPSRISKIWFNPNSPFGLWEISYVDTT
jgi:hypothetical protein